MRRFRIVFVVLVLLLLAPIVLLVQRAVQSLDLERTVRHQVIAERVFDEMERSLSRFLEPEEQRPFDGYVAAVPSSFPPFLVTYFQVDPDGIVHISAPKQTSGTNVMREMDDLVRHFRQGRTDQPIAALSQLPGTTVPISPDVGAAAPPQAAKDSEKRDASTFDALRSLNKAATERLERQRKLEDYEPTGRQNELSDVRDRDTFAGSEQAPSKAQQAVPPLADLPPMIGQLADTRRLLLYRTAIHAGETYRQGALLDLDQLCAWLRDQAIGESEISGYSTLTCSTSSDPAALKTAAAAFIYQHRFADPFDAVTARLQLRQLPGADSAMYVYALCALLLATGVLGLASLYRMVTVAMRYAERRSDFVAAVSHELKTPLTAIRMYGEMLRDGMVPSDAKRNEYYRHITGESERLTRLINNVLELSRLEKGNRQMTMTSGSLAAVVSEVADLLRPHLEAEGFRLSVETADHLPEVRFERDALIQILSNLIDNAVKYAVDATDKRIELRVGTAQGRVSIIVRDHGPGVPKRLLGTIFDPFYRGESELTRRHKGTGIGLALVRGLAQRMNAQVVARNHRDGGLEVDVSWRVD